MDTTRTQTRAPADGPVEHRLQPDGGSWLALTPPDADAATRLVFACLEHGVLEAWQDAGGRVRLYLPDDCGGHCVDGPELGFRPDRCGRGARAARVVADRRERVWRRSATS